MASRLIPDPVRRVWEERVKPPLERWEHLDGIRGFIQFVIPLLIAVKLWLVVGIGALLLFADVVGEQFGYGVHVLRQDVALYTAISGILIVIILMLVQARYRPQFPDLLPSTEGKGGTIIVTEPIMPPPDEEPPKPGSARSLPAKPKIADEDEGDYRLLFGVLWKITKKRVRNIFPQELILLGQYSTRTEVEAQPFCPNDRTLLSYIDRNGERYLMPDDVMGYDAGDLYCPTCKLRTRPDPKYSGQRALSIYRHEVERLVRKG